MNFKTINDLNDTIKNNIYKIPKDVDLIVGIPRSGMLPASIISLYLNIPLTDIDNLLKDNIYSIGKTKKNNNWIKNISEARNILIVEDSSNSGNSIKEIRKKLSDYKYKEKCKILAIYVRKTTTSYPDIYFEICDVPRIFEWNYLHHGLSEQFCYDIDGVLCEDPTEIQNDDGEKYIDFILNAKPKFIPTSKIGYIITSRLEKYREETEIWLKNNNIHYNKLIMLNLPNKEERIRLKMHGKFKAQEYKKLKDTIIFVESSYEQAYEISKLSNKAVFCTENSKYIEPGTVEKIKTNLKYSWKDYIAHIIPYPIKKIIKKIIKVKK